MLQRSQNPETDTLDRLTFLSRKQKSNESLQQFWNALTGLASKRALEGQTESLILDVFILNMNNKKMQERLCTEPKEPEEALRFRSSVRGRSKKTEKLWCRTYRESHT